MVAVMEDDLPVQAQASQRPTPAVQSAPSAEYDLAPAPSKASPAGPVETSLNKCSQCGSLYSSSRIRKLKGVWTCDDCADAQQPATKAKPVPTQAVDAQATDSVLAHISFLGAASLLKLFGLNGCSGALYFNGQLVGQAQVAKGQGFDIGVTTSSGSHEFTIGDFPHSFTVKCRLPEAGEYWVELIYSAWTGFRPKVSRSAPTANEMLKVRQSADLDRARRKSVAIKAIATVFVIILVVARVVLKSTTGTNTPNASGLRAGEPDLEITAYVHAEQYVRERLVWDGSAEFPAFSHNVKSEGNGRYNVAGYVNASNAFGAKKQIFWICIVRYANGQWSCEEVRFP